jgi:hypothetical protein
VAVGGGNYFGIASYTRPQKTIPNQNKITCSRYHITKSNTEICPFSKNQKIPVNHNQYNEEIPFALTLK